MKPGEIRGNINYEHPQILSYLKQRLWEYLYEMLGSSNKDNRCNYEENIKTLNHLLHRYEKALLPEGNFVLSTNPVYLSSILKEELLGELGCFLTFSVQPEDIRQEEEMLLYHMLQVAVLNAARDYISEHFLESSFHYYYKKDCLNQKIYGSCFYGPGIMGMSLGLYDQLYRYVTEKEVISSGIASFLGVVAIGTQPFHHRVPCKDCNPNGGCRFCMIYHQKRKEEGK